MPTDSGVFRDDTDTPVGGRIVRAYRRDTGAMLGEAVSSSGGGGSDANFSSVALLLHADGADASTTFLDSSPSGKTVTTVGNAKISTAQSKFGGASAYFDGSGDKLTVPDSSDFAFGTGDFTIESFFYLTGGGAYARLIHFGPFWSSNNAFGINLKDADYPGKLSFASYKLGGRPCVSSSSVSLNTWHHVAVTRSAGVFRLFFNGTLESENSSYVGQSIEDVSSNYAAVGSTSTYVNGDEDMAGYVDELRITKGVARYTSSFTPPTAPFPNTATALELGQYEITHSHTGERQIVFLDDAGGTTYNDKILRVV